MKEILTKKQILLIEDDVEIAAGIKNCLKNADWEITHSNNGVDGLTLAISNSYAVIILDLGLPGMDGLDICKTLRSLNNNTPVLILSSRHSEPERVNGLNIGADDYLGKPFSGAELFARVKAILRRSEIPNNATHNQKILTNKKIKIDLNSAQVFIDEKETSLSYPEFLILKTLLQEPEKVFSKDELLKCVWGYENDSYGPTVAIHINRLRDKIEVDPANPKLLLTVRGFGYKLSAG